MFIELYMGALWIPKEFGMIQKGQEGDQTGNRRNPGRIQKASKMQPKGTEKIPTMHPKGIQKASKSYQKDVQIS